jgi:hypothetical protein
MLVILSRAPSLNQVTSGQTGIKRPKMRGGGFGWLGLRGKVGSSHGFRERTATNY